METKYSDIECIIIKWWSSKEICVAKAYPIIELNIEEKEKNGSMRYDISICSAFKNTHYKEVKEFQVKKVKK